LDIWLGILGLTRQDIIIDNIVKCFTNNNRSPVPCEVYFCRDRFLPSVFGLYQPAVVFILGQCACQGIFDRNFSVTTNLGRIFNYKFYGRNIHLIPLYHPGYCLRNPSSKQKMEVILQNLKDFVESKVVHV
ncbi:unnamed protein product, partial [marine sediment metagenome]